MNLLNEVSLGIPQEVIDAVNGFVMRSRRIRTIDFYSKRVIEYGFDVAGRRFIKGIRTVTTPYFKDTTTTLTGYALNFVHDLIHNHGYSYEGMLDGKMVFHKPEKEFYDPTLVLTAERVKRINDQSPQERDQYIAHPSGKGYIVYMHPQTILLSTDDEEVVVEWDNDPEQYNYIGTLNGRRQTIVVSEDDVAEQLGIGVDELRESVFTTWTGTPAQTENHISSAFIFISEINSTQSPDPGNESWHNVGVKWDLIVNGKVMDPKDYGKMITHYGKQTSLILKVERYNSCTLAESNANGYMGYDAGNFGLCAAQTYPDLTFPNPVSDWFDTEKEFAVMQLLLCEKPLTGKEYRIAGIIDAKTKDWLQALPRKTPDHIVVM